MKLVDEAIIEWTLEYNVLFQTTCLYNTGTYKN